MPGDVLIFVSGGDDPIVPEFQEYCRRRHLELLLATDQSRTRLYYELPAGQALLKIEQHGGRWRALQPSDLRGIWFRRMPDPPAEIDAEDTIYSGTEFAACFVGFLRCTGIPSFGLSRDAPFRPALNLGQVYACSNRLGFPLLGDLDDSPLLPIPIREHLSARQAERRKPSASPALPTRDARPDGIYYVLFANRRQILAQDGCHSRELLARALRIGDRIACDLRLESALIEMGVEQGGTIALGCVGPYVTDDMILRDPAWYFDAVLDELDA